MVLTESNKLVSRSKKETPETTQTLWNNEIQANIFVARLMIVTSAFALVFLALNLAGVFIYKKSLFTATILLMIAMLSIPSSICLFLKGEKKWLKTFLMVFFCISFFGVEMFYGDHTTLCLVIPIILSIRYYSKETTSLLAVLTIAVSLVAEYFGVAKGFGRIDLNRVYLPAGTKMIFTESARLRDMVPVESIDHQQLWMEVLRHNTLTKMIFLALISLICIEIAKRGRKAILDQQAETQKTERLESELDLASRIQNNVLPSSFPAFPEGKEFTLYASMSAARKIGGDFYDYFFVDQDHLALVIADVSGKGVGAALFMMLARILIKTRAQMGGSPCEILTDVNNKLCEENKELCFVTAWLGILDVTNGKVVASNAGHEYPAIRRHGEKYELMIGKHSFVLGGMEGTKYKEHEFLLNPGDSLFLYTDGVPEAQNCENVQFGTDRMLDALNKKVDSLPEESIVNVRTGINEFIGDAEQFDDVTMLSIQYTGIE